MSSPRVVVVGGPSGSGKSTLIRAMIGEGGVRLAVSATTRPPRDGERDGVDYHFVGRDRFLHEDGGHFLEWAEVHGDLYGTPSSEIDALSDNDRVVLLDVDVQGLRSLKERDITLLSIFIAPPSLAVLEKRLRDRGTESEERIATRLRNAESEMAAQDEYDELIVNEELVQSIERFRALLHEKSRNQTP